MKKYKEEVSRRDPRGALGRMSGKRQRTEIGKNSTETAKWEGEVTEDPWEREDELM